MTMTGRKEMTAPTLETWSRSAAQPQPKTAPTAPMPAASESRYPRVAVSGTATERKTTVSRTRDRPATTIPKGSREALRDSATSMATAACPVTMTSLMP